MYEILTHVIGFLGTALFIVSYQCKSSGRLVFFQLVGGILYVIHFFMLGAYTGCVTQAISIACNAVVCCNRWSWAAWKGWKWLFSALFVAAMVVTWQGPLSLLPCIASVTTTFVYLLRNGKAIRLGRLFVASPGWMIYNACTHSYSGILCEIFGIASILISLRRYGLKALDQVS